MSEENDVISMITANVVEGVINNLPDGVLPEPDMVNFYKLAEKRILWLDTTVDLSMVAHERMILLWNLEDIGLPVEKRKPIRLMIFNYGGDADMAYSMIDIIKASKTPVYTYNMGMSASAAGLILMAGHKRFGLPNSQVLIHQGSASVEGDIGKVLDANDVIKKSVKKMQDFILENTHIPSQLLKRKKSNDWTLNAQEALDYGVIDHLITDLDVAFDGVQRSYDDNNKT